MTYTVVYRPGHDREERTEHRSWGAAFNRGRKLEQQDSGAVIEIIEKDRDGERTYNLAGKIISRDGIGE